MQDGAKMEDAAGFFGLSTDTDLCLRRAALYPAELWVRHWRFYRQSPFQAIQYFAQSKSLQLNLFWPVSPA